MNALIVLVLYMLALLPSRGERDMLFRIASAEAILRATDNVQEQLTLARIQKYESGFRRNVARCEVLGDHGKSKGGWQVQPMSASDAKDACGSLDAQAALALRYMRRAAEVCPKNEGPAKLNLYVSGRCAYGLKQSEERWGVTEITLFSSVPENDTEEREQDSAAAE